MARGVVGVPKLGKFPHNPPEDRNTPVGNARLSFYHPLTLGDWDWDRTREIGFGLKRKIGIDRNGFGLNRK